MIKKHKLLLFNLLLVTMFGAILLNDACQASCSVNNINAVLWVTFLSPVITIVGLYFMISRRNKQQIDLMRQQLDTHALMLKQTREVEYRRTNISNKEIIIKEVEIFYERVNYGLELKHIEELFGSIIGINVEYQKIHHENIRFLKKLRHDFYYEPEIVELLDEYLVIEDTNPLVYFDVSKRIAKYFISSNINENELIDLNVARNMAYNTIYQRMYTTPNKQHIITKFSYLYVIKANMLVASRKELDESPELSALRLLLDKYDFEIVKEVIQFVTLENHRHNHDVSRIKKDLMSIYSFDLDIIDHDYIVAYKILCNLKILNDELDGIYNPLLNDYEYMQRFISLSHNSFNLENYNSILQDQIKYNRYM